MHGNAALYNHTFAPNTLHIFHLDWLLSRFYSYALHSVFFRIILLNIFEDAVLKTWFLENDWSCLQAWYSWLISCWSLQFSHSTGSHSFWASLWYARGIKRLEVAGLWSSKLVSLVRCNPSHFFQLHQYLFRWVSAPSVPLEDCSFQSSSAGLQPVSDVVSTPLDSFKGQQAPTSLLSDSTWWDRYL